MSDRKIFVRRVAAAVGLAALAAALPIAGYSNRGGGPSGGVLPVPAGFVPDERQFAPHDDGDAKEKAAALDKVFTAFIEPSLGPQLGMDEPRKEWVAKDVEKDEYDVWHFNVTQVYKGVAVNGGELTIHMNEQGTFGTEDEPVWLGNYQDQPAVDVRPKISKKSAIKIAQDMVQSMVRRQRAAGVAPATQGAGGDRRLRAKAKKLKDTAGLEIHPGSGPGKRELTYKVVTHSEELVDGGTGLTKPIQMVSWVGAQNSNRGKVLASYNNIQDVHPEYYYGKGQYGYFGYGSGNSYWPTYNLYVLNDPSNLIGTYTMANGTTTVYNCNNGLSRIWGNYLRSNANTNNADTHTNTVRSMSFEVYILGRAYPNGAYGPRVYGGIGGNTMLSARNHYSSNYVNAFWNGREITIGDGNNTTASSLSCLDVVAHEWTHGLVQFTANLAYVNESGALNESFADVMGNMTERYWFGESSNTWKVGEQCWTPAIAGDALRYMDRPTIDGSSRDYYPSRYVGSADNGGVHWNSGIPNNAFYLLATGGSHRVTGAMSGGIGASKATQIWWRALRYFLSSSSNMRNARYATAYAAYQLYGLGIEFNRTHEAWDKVGVPR